MFIAYGLPSLSSTTPGGSFSFLVDVAELLGPAVSLISFYLGLVFSYLLGGGCVFFLRSVVMTELVQARETRKQQQGGAEEYNTKYI